MMRRGGVPVVSPGQTPSPSVAQGSRQTAGSTVSRPSRATTSRPATRGDDARSIPLEGCTAGEPPEVGRSNRSCEPECRIAGNRYHIGADASFMLGLSGENQPNDLQLITRTLAHFYHNYMHTFKHSLQNNIKFTFFPSCVSPRGRCGAFGPGRWRAPRSGAIPRIAPR
jgi:hypothetical protein